MTASRRIALAWNPAFRVIPTRFPAISLFDRVAGAQDFDVLHALEAMINDRLRDELGEISLVPPEERLYGPGSGPIMATFTHPNPAGSRFSDGRYGVFYCARDRQTAVADPPPSSAVHGGHARAADAAADALVFGGSQRPGRRPAGGSAPRTAHRRSRQLRLCPGHRPPAEGRRGAGHSLSVGAPAQGRKPRRLRTGIVRDGLHAAYLEYNWDGRAIDAVFEVSQLD